MSTLQERLDRIKADFAGQIPDAAKAIMVQAEKELCDSGIMSRIPAPGSQLVAFQLSDTEGQQVSSADLLSRGPLLLTVYRGAW